MPRRDAAIPHTPELPAALEPAEVGELSHDASYTECEVVDAVLSDQQANGVIFDAARLVNVELAGSRLDDLRLTDTELKRCNLANTRAQRAEAARVTFDGSRMTGIQLSEASLRDVTIRDCRVDLASFGFSQLTRVTFESCVLDQTDFLESKLESVRFHSCQLTRADFRGARMQQCEFRRCNLNGLQGVESLRGAAMEWPDIVDMAGVWATALGIEVLDSD